MIKFLFAICLGCFILQGRAQNNDPKPVAVQTELQRPKLVVGIVIDQMRWDYLYRYYNRYSSGGFKRLLNDGFACENTMIPYMPTVTACGHASIYTGSVPAIHGIIGNEWWDNETGKAVYCTGDDLVKMRRNRERDPGVVPHS